MASCSSATVRGSRSSSISTNCSRFFRESIRIRNNFRATGDRDLPTWSQLEQIAHITVAQRYLDQVDAILGRSDKIDADAFRQHFNRRLYSFYTIPARITAGNGITRAATNSMTSASVLP